MATVWRSGGIEAPCGGSVVAQGKRMRLELNYRSKQAVLDAAMALLAPAYEEEPQRQLRLIGAAEAAAAEATALAQGASGGGGGGGDGSGGHGSGGAGSGSVAARAASRAPAAEAASAVAAAARRGEARVVEVVGVDDHEAEAEYVVDQILRLRDHATSGATGGRGGNGGGGEGSGSDSGGAGGGTHGGTHGGGGTRQRAPSVAVLYRTNAQAMPLERELLRQGVRYQVVQARSFFQRKEVKDALCYLRLLLSNDTLALERVVNVPPRKIGKTTWANLGRAAAADGTDVWSALERAVAPPSPPSPSPPSPPSPSPPSPPPPSLLLDEDSAADEYAEEYAEDEAEPPVKPLSRAAVKALSGFHQLITSFRADVAEATAAEEAARRAARAEAGGGDGSSHGSEGDGVGGGAGDGAGDSDGGDTAPGGAALQLAGTDLQYRLASASAQQQQGHQQRRSQPQAASPAVAAAAAATSSSPRSASSSSEGEWGEEEGKLAWLFRRLLRESGYEAMVKAEEGGGRTRWRNLGELATMAAAYGTSASEVQAFLDQVALVSDMDAMDEHGTKGGGAGSVGAGGEASVGSSGAAAADEAVRLMTVHASKGLEFDVVYVVGVEEGLFPHHYSMDSEHEVDEERRLLYVAMTRAKRRLVMTHADRRGHWGKIGYAEPSRFLEALPHELVGRRRVRDARDRRHRAR